MLRKIALVIALAPSLWLSSAFALGLGDISVHSQLNQRFSAIIPLNDISEEDAGALQVRIADNADFAKAGIERTDYLSTLTFEVKTVAGVSQIVISSSKIAREPFLSFLLDVDSKGTQLMRAYTVLLDPPAYSEPAAATAETPAAVSATSATQALPAQVANPQPANAEADANSGRASQEVGQGSPASPVATEAEQFAPAAATPSVYGPVKAGETLWSIASRLRGTSAVSMDQMMLAIHGANPRAFDDGHLHVQKGAMLKVPTLAQIRSVGPLQARQRIEQIKSEHVGTMHRPVAKERVKAKPAAASTPEPAATAAESAPVPTPAISEPAAAKPAPSGEPAANTAEPAPASATPVTAAVPAAQTPVPAATETATPAQQTPAPATTPAATLPGSAPTEGAEASAPAPVATPAPAVPRATAGQRPRPVPSMMEDTGLLYPAAGAALVLLLGFLGWRTWKKHQDAAPAPIGTGLRGGMRDLPPIVPAKAGGLLQPPSLKPAATVTPSPVMQPPVIPPQMPKPESTAQLPSFDSTQMIDSPADAAKASTKAIDTDTVDFDVTGKFEASTMKVDLEGDDPLTEADFHLAYGLYDEAALLLGKAAEKNPQRTDLRVKLAETYFRAGKALEFQETAESLKSKLPAAEWQKIAIMGHQLIPDSELFAGIGSAAAEPLAQHMDLSFDEPVVATPVTLAAPAGKPAADDLLDFKLEDFDGGKPAAAPPTPAKSTAGASNTLEFNLADFDLEKPTLPPASAKAVEAPKISLDDVRIDDFSLDQMPEDSHAISAGDEAATKLDLARAYVDMGDNETARTLLNEVLHQGNPAQQKDAEALIKRMA